jgi:hypothetical protein
MTRKKGYRIDYVLLLAAITIGCFSVASRLHPLMPKTVQQAKFSRNWTTVVKEMYKAADDERILEIGKSAGLKIIPQGGI